MRWYRREVIRGTAVLAALVGAGCLGDDDQEFAGGDGDPDEWLSDVNGYDGISDRTDTDSVEIDVGGDSGHTFSPPAVRVSAGTTVVWEWTGTGGAHDVVHVDREFESDLTSDAGTTFEYRFDDTGTFNYLCTPHEALEMKGSVVVE